MDRVSALSWYSRPQRTNGSSSSHPDEGWWWSQSDLVRENHLNGHQASYYAPREVNGANLGTELQIRGHDGMKEDSPRSAGPQAAEAQQHRARPSGELQNRTQDGIAFCDPRGGRQAGQDHSADPFATGYYIFISPMKINTPEQSMSLPPMSSDGGSEEEFQEFWRRNRRPRHLVGGWVERVAHPQVNVEPYWYNTHTGETVWQQPDCAEQRYEYKELEPLTGEGPAWTMSVKELKTILSGGRAAEHRLETEELAKRAVAEYEKFEPRVLSWHDYQYITFWFFGGLDKKDKDRDRNAKSFFGAENGDGRELFADDAFFHATGDLLMTRMHLMHPISLTYLVWTYSRANVVIPHVMEAIADHFCEGRIPIFDRCSLGTMVWNFSKQGLRLDRFFEDCGLELARPNRLRSLAARNFQNSMIAFSRRRHWNEKMVDAMARGIQRLLDKHDVRYPKTDKNVLFSYTCKDRSEVPADAFRIGSCTVIAKAFQEIRAAGSIVERCLASMLDYTLRCVERSPPMMREPGDACNMVRQLAYIAEARRLNVSHLLKGLDYQKICEGAAEKNVGQMFAALRRCGIRMDEQRQT